MRESEKSQSNPFKVAKKPRPFGKRQICNRNGCNSPRSAACQPCRLSPLCVGNLTFTFTPASIGGPLALITGVVSNASVSDSCFAIVSATVVSGIGGLAAGVPGTVSPVINFVILPNVKCPCPPCPTLESCVALSVGPPTSSLVAPPTTVATSSRSACPFGTISVFFSPPLAVGVAVAGTPIVVTIPVIVSAFKHCHIAQKR